MLLKSFIVWMGDFLRLQLRFFWGFKKNLKTIPGFNFLPCVSDRTLGFLFAWGSFLNFSIIYHQRRLIIFKIKESLFLSLVSVLPLVDLCLLPRSSPVAFWKLYLEILANHQVYQVYFLFFALLQVQLLVNFPPLCNKDPVFFHFQQHFLHFTLILPLQSSHSNQQIFIFSVFKSPLVVTYTFLNIFPTPHCLCIYLCYQNLQ